MAETIFYITGSIFFFLSSTILAVMIIYSIKILQKIVSIETEMKNAVIEVKNKITSFSIGFAGIAALLEKLIDMRAKSKDRKSNKKKNEE